jgi:hypothetical protein
VRTLLLLFVLLPALAYAEDRPRVLVPLYAGQVGLQAYDAYSTVEVIRLGGVETNPHVNTILTRQPALFFALKAAVATGTIVTAERLWKSGRRKEAVAVMIGSNAFMGYVAVNNASVLRQMRER